MPAPKNSKLDEKLKQFNAKTDECRLFNNGFGIAMPFNVVMLNLDVNELSKQRSKLVIQHDDSETRMLKDASTQEVEQPKIDRWLQKINAIDKQYKRLEPTITQAITSLSKLLATAKDEAPDDAVKPTDNDSEPPSFGR
jgi:hypothetical protein